MCFNGTFMGIDTYSQNRRLRRRFSRPSGVGGVQFVNQVIPSFLSIAIKYKKVWPHFGILLILVICTF